MAEGAEKEAVNRAARYAGKVTNPLVRCRDARDSFVGSIFVQNEISVSVMVQW